MRTATTSLASAKKKTARDWSAPFASKN